MVVISIMFIKSEEPITQKLITDYIHMSTVDRISKTDYLKLITDH